MFPVNSGDNIYVPHGLWDGMEIVYSLFLLAAFGAIAFIVVCRRQMLKVRDHEIQSQALFVGGASEAREPRFCGRRLANSLRFLIKFTDFCPFGMA